MNKTRPFQLGLGIGLVLGALLLQIIWTIQNASVPVTYEDSAAQTPESVQVEEWTPSIIRERADSVGLQVYDKEIVLYRQDQLDDAVAAALLEYKQVNGHPAEVTIFVTSGMSASTVVDYLYRSGILANKADLEVLLHNNLASSIRAGLYTFHVNHDPEQIVSSLTTGPSFE